MSNKKNLLSFCFLLLINFCGFAQLQQSKKIFIPPAYRNVSGQMQRANSNTTSATTCAVDTILLTTQAQINNFAATYPTCANPKYLIINGKNASPAITSLAGLSSITEVQNKLTITHTSLTSLAALNGITFIGDTLEVTYNNLLTSLGMSNLTQLGSLRLRVLPVLTSIAGIANNIQSTGSITIDSTGLTSLTALSNIDSLTTPNGGLNISVTPITTLSTLTDLKRIKGYMNIQDISQITTLGIPNLQQCWGFLCGALPNLTTLGTLTHHLDNDNKHTGSFWFVQTGLTNLSGMDSIVSSANFLIWINPNLTSLQGLNHLSGTTNGEISIWANDVLANTSALSGITGINYGNLTLEENPLLTNADLMGLKNIVNIEEGLRINNMQGITSLNFLDSNLVIQNLNNIDSIRIYDNSQLAVCNAKPICTYLNNGGKAFINNNSAGCNTKAQIIASCAAVSVYGNDAEDNCCTTNAIVLNEGAIKTGNVGQYLGQDINDDPYYDDYDMYKIVLTHDGAVRLFSQAKNDSCFNLSTTMNFGVTVLDANGNNIYPKTLLTFSDNICNQEKFDTSKFRAFTAGTYYLRLEGSNRISYRVSYQFVDSTGSDIEPNNSVPTAIFTIANQTKKGHVSFAALNTNDAYDHYKIKLPHAANVKVLLKTTYRGATNSSANNFAVSINNTANFISSAGMQPDAVRYDTLQFCGIAADTSVIILGAYSPTYLSNTAQAFEYEFKYVLTDSLPSDIEPNGTFATATSIVFNQNYQNTIRANNLQGNDFEDYFKTVVPKSGTMKLIINANPGSCNPSGSFTIKLYDKSFTQQLSIAASGDTVNFCNVSADTVYLKFEASSFFAYNFNYTMVDTAFVDAEPNNNFTQAVFILQDSSKKGSVGYKINNVIDDYDYYKIATNKDGTIKIMSAVTFNKCDAFPYIGLSVYDRNQNPIVSNFVPSNTNLGVPGTTYYDTLSLCGKASDTFYVVYNTPTNRSLNYSFKYTLADTSVNDVEPNNSFVQALPINILDTKRGHIRYSNSGGTDTYDYYKAFSPTDGTIKIITQVTNTSCANGQNVYMRVFDKNQGQLLEKYVGSSSVLAGQTVFDTTVICGRASDSFYVRFEATNPFIYQLKYDVVDTSANDIEPNNTFAQALPINILENKKGHIRYNQTGGSDTYDYYKAYTPTDGTLKIITQVTNTSCANGQNVYMRVYDKNQGQLLEKYVGSNSVAVGQTVFDTTFICGRASDSFYVRFEATNPFIYQLKYDVVDTSANDVEPNNSFAQATLFGGSQTKKGHIRYNASGGTDSYDYYKIVFDNTDSLKLQLQATNMSCVNGQNVYLRVYNKFQNQLLEKYLGSSNVAPGQTITDSIKILVTAPDTIFVRFEATSPFKYQFKSNLLLPSSGFTITGDTSICFGIKTYKAINVADSSVAYNWSLPNGGGTISFVDSIASVNWNTAGTKQVQLFLSNTVGNSNTKTKNVIVNNNPPSAAPVIVNSNRNLSTSSIPPVAYCQWFKNGVVIPSATDTSYYAADAGTFTAKFISPCGLSPVSNSIVFATAVLTQAITFTHTPNITMSPTAKAKLNAAASSGLPVTFILVSGSATIVNDTLYAQHAGTIIVKATQAGDNFYSSANVKYDTITVIQGLQTISFNNIPDQFFNGTNVNLFGTSNTGLPLTYTIVSGFASASGNIVSLNGIGTVVVRAQQIGNSDYAPSSIINKTFCVYVNQIAGTIQGETTPCVSSTFAYSINAINGATYTWWKLGGDTLSSNTSSVTINWPITGVQKLLVSLKSNCSVASIPDTLNVLVTSTLMPIAVSNMLPADSSVNLPLPINLSWQPGSNTNLFDLYIWPINTTRPPTPYYSNFTDINVDVSNGLDSGVLYNWQIVSKNSCQITNGAIKRFSPYINNTRPDLRMTTMTQPSTATAGNNITVTWNVENIGNGTTGAVSWKDRIYLSENNDLRIGNSPILLGEFNNITYLQPGESYAQSKSLNLPAGLTGTYQLFVITDNIDAVCWSTNQCDSFWGPRAFHGGTLNESNENNNYRYGTIVIGYGNLPDLLPVSIANPSSSFGGDSINITYQVTNIGNVAAIGNTNGTCNKLRGWNDGIFISNDSIFNPTTAKSLTTSGFLRTVPQAYCDTATAGLYDFLLPGNSYNNINRVLIPNNFYGNAYIYIKTNADNGTLEGPYNNNNVQRGNQFNVVLRPPPDLIVSNLSIPSAAIAGQGFAVDWTVLNQGANAPFSTENTWVDSIYISTSNVLDANAVFVGTNNHYNGNLLNAGSNYQSSFNVIIPDAYQGNYYVFVVTDAQNKVFEFNQEGNNVKRSLNPINITLAPPVDLYVSKIIAPDSVIVGNLFAVNWDVENQGIGAINKSIVDEIYYSIDSTLTNPNLILLGEYPRNVILAAGETKNYSKQFQINNVSTSQKIFFFIRTDVPNVLFEYLAEGNNLSTSKMVGSSGSSYIKTPVISTIILPKPDLVVSNFNAPTNALSGTSIPITWKVTNSGSVATNSPIWVDKLYVSSDSLLDQSDVEIGSFVHNGNLIVGGNYTKNVSVILPVDVIGNKKIIVITDYTNNITNDSIASNNVAFKNIIIAAAPTPDLIVTVVGNTPSTIYAGSQFFIKYTVKNMGAVPTAMSNWYDVALISTNPQVYYTDYPKGSKQHSGVLGVNQTYQDSILVNIPIYLSGNYYLTIFTDKNKDVFEGFAGENNNWLNTVINIQTLASLPLSDLVVSKVTLPSTGIIGDSITGNVTIKNIGGNPVLGNLSNGLFLSSNNVYNGATALLLNNQISNVVINGGDSISKSISGTAIVPNAGNYFGIAKTNLNGIIPELNLSNNTLSSTSTINLDAKLITLDLIKLDTLKINRAKYYKINVAAGLDLLATITTNTSGQSGTNNMYLAYNRIPTALDFDQKNRLSSGLNQQLLLPNTQAGTYYLMVIDQDIQIVQPVSILVRAIPFSIIAITPNVVGKSVVSTRIYGGGFKTNSRIILRSGATQINEGTLYQFINSTEIVVKWNLTNVPIGTYTVVVINPNLTETNLAAGLQVVQSSGFNISFDPLLPSLLRLGQSGTFTFVGKNVGNVDVPFYMGDITMQSDVKINSVVTSGNIRKQTKFFTDTVYKHFNDWYQSVSTKIIPFVGSNLAPNEEFTITFNASNFVQPYFQMDPRVLAMDKGMFIRSAADYIESLRTFFIKDPSFFDLTSNSRVLQAANLGSKYFIDSVFVNYVNENYFKFSDTIGLNLPYNCSLCLKGYAADTANVNNPVSTINTFSVGAYPGLIDVANNLVFNPGARFDVKISKSHYWPGYTGNVGVQGNNPGWDYMKINGTLDIQSTSANPFLINFKSISIFGVPGKMAGWYPAADTNWPIIKATGGIINFNTNKFNLNTALFTSYNLAYGGTFSLVLSADSKTIFIKFTAFVPGTGQNGVPGVDGLDAIGIGVVGEPGSPGGKSGPSGNGGRGGKGGKGSINGKGGRGGNGGDACFGGNAGNGGEGGIGGISISTAGEGGTGGNGGNVTSGAGDAGIGGVGGEGANGCTGGDAGIGGNACCGGKGGNGGKGGRGGKQGNTPAPATGGKGGNGGSGVPNGNGGNGGDAGAGNGGTNAETPGGAPGIGASPGAKSKYGKNPCDKRELPTSQSDQDWLNEMKKYSAIAVIGDAAAKISNNQDPLNPGHALVSPADHPSIDLAIYAAKAFNDGKDAELSAIKDGFKSGGTNGAIEAASGLASTAMKVTLGFGLRAYNVAAQGINGKDYAGQAATINYINGVDKTIENVGNIKSLADIFAWWTAQNLLNPKPSITVPVKAPCVPNEIIGPIGYSNPFFVNGNIPQPYAIHFENDSTFASLSSQKVVIRQQIHPKLNPLSFRLGSFGFGGRTFNVNPNSSTLNTVLDLKDSLGYNEEVIAGVDIVNNELFWVFQTIDPLTGLTPANPLIGFLPINDSLGRGKGFVNYIITPIPTAQTGDTIAANANIYFDVNPPIPTNTWVNTLDMFPPITHITSLTSSLITNKINIAWAGMDDVGGSGIKYYTIYVSKNNGPYTIYANNLKRTDTTYAATLNNSYCFFVLATDNVGNTELLNPANIMCANIFAPLPIPLLSFSGTNVNRDNVLSWTTNNEQNSKLIEVQRSFDGNNFIKIGNVNAAGFSNSNVDYNFTDFGVDKLNSNLFYYRLKLVDNDNSFKLSNIVKLIYNQKNVISSIVYPNPTNALINIFIGDKKVINTIATLTDINGKIIKIFLINYSTQSLDMTPYPDGVYFIKLANNEVLKIINQK